MMRKARIATVMVSVGLALWVATSGATASELVTTKGERKIVAVNPQSGQARVIFRSKDDIVTALACAGEVDRIVFVTQDKEYVFGDDKRVTEKVWVMTGSGSKLRKVRQFSWVTQENPRSAISVRKRSRFDTPIVDIDISDNGRRILIARDFQLQDFSVSGGPIRYLNRNKPGVFDPEYVPGDKKITAFFDADKFGIGTLDLAGGDLKSLRYRVGGREIDYFDGQPTFSPDGDRIAFGSSGVDSKGNVVGGGPAPIWTMNPDGRNARPIPATKDLNFRVENPVFSPNGQDIAVTVDTYSEKSGSVGRIMVTSLRGKHLTTLFRDRHYQYQRYLGWLR